MVNRYQKSFADHIGYAGPDRTPYRLGRPDAGRQSDWNSRITDENPQVIWKGVAVLSGPRRFSPGSVDRLSDQKRSAKRVCVQSGFKKFKTTCIMISEERGKDLERTALRMVGSYAQFVLDQKVDYDYFKYPDRIVNDMEAINTNMVQLMMMKYMLRLEENRVKFPNLDWPCLNLELKDNKLDNGHVETLQDCCNI